MLQWGRNLFVAECSGCKGGNDHPTHSFNGAATCSLRNVVQAYAGKMWGAFASMGPQLVRCGMCGAAGGRLRTGHASMGPQLVRCGMPDLTEWPKESRSSFNGAATCSLRNVYRANFGTEPDAGLQWGRNLFVAECLGTRRGLIHTYSLQWGRNLFVAECGHRAGRRSRVLPASMGPQLVRCGMSAMDSSLTVMEALQWGRNLFVAECGKAGGGAVLHLQASMGPQLVRCGM